MILAVDPGPTESAYAFLDNELKPYQFGKVANEMLSDIIESMDLEDDAEFCIEMVASYGMSVGKEVFETVFWIGRFWETAIRTNCIYMTKVYRKDVKMNLCGSMKAKDSNIRQALIDRFGVVGTKKNKGWFYGISKDVWSAIAVGVTYADIFLKESDNLG